MSILPAQEFRERVNHWLKDASGREVLARRSQFGGWWMGNDLYSDNLLESGGWTWDGPALAPSEVQRLEAFSAARVTELLEANNREVERRREAERQLAALQILKRWVDGLGLGPTRARAQPSPD